MAAKLFSLKVNFGDFSIFASYIMERRMGVLRLCLAAGVEILKKW